jgi:serine/threonine-protein kinase
MGQFHGFPFGGRIARPGLDASPSTNLAGYGAGVSSPETFSAGSIVGGRYRVEGIVGSGAMGAIFRVVDEAASTRLALKALPAAFAGAEAHERRARFEREAAVCATIRHPHVVPVLGHGVDDASGVAYLVMPLLEGEDMAALLDRTGTLEPSVAAALFVQACEGLSAVHARGVVHRDVKPSNLFLVREGGGIVLKVTDFGLAKVHGDESTDVRTATGRFMGTPQYVSPEQAVSAKHVDARSDVFSLAMSLYHALAGAPAFAYAKSFMKLVLEITSQEAPSLAAAASWVPPALVRVVHGALLRDPGVRCPSVAELALALDSACGIDATRRTVSPEMLRPSSAEERALGRSAGSGHVDLPADWAEVLRG